MALGPGRYDDVLKDARAKTGAANGALLILDGDDGHGFAVQMDAVAIHRLPTLLREMADQIEADLRRPDFATSMHVEPPIDRGNREQRRAARRRSGGGRD